MARDGAGTYSVPNTFLPNTTMSATAVNQNFTDAGSEITNSLARDGQSSMSGQFKATDGTVTAPGVCPDTSTVPLIRALLCTNQTTAVLFAFGMKVTVTSAGMLTEV